MKLSVTMYGQKIAYIKVILVRINPTARQSVFITQKILQEQ